MRILITSIIDLRKSSHNRLHQFIKQLSWNHSITSLSINDWWKSSQADVSQYRLGVEDMLEGVDIKYFTARKLSPYLQEVFSFVTLNRILKEIDYTSFDVHLNYSTLISGYYVAKKLKSAGINTVYDIADDLPGMIRNSPQIPPVLRPLGRMVGTTMVNKNIKISRAVTCINSSLRDSYHVPQDKFELIPNGVDTELFKNYPSQQLRQELGLEADFVVGYVGVLREWVDLEPVFAALSQLAEDHSNIKLLIVGEEGRLKQNKDLSRRYGVSDRLVLTGTVPYVKVPQYISCMDVCLIPFKPNEMSRNAVPLKLFEYMACEKPVICSKLKGVARIAEDKILYASNQGEYKKGLGALYNNKELRERLGVNGRKFVEEYYRWTSMTSKLEEVLKSVSGGQS